MANIRRLKFEELAAAVANGESVRAAAARLNVKPRTSQRWSTRPEFIERVHKLRAEIDKRIVKRTAAVSLKAIDALEEAIEHKKQNKLAVVAARTVLNVHLRIQANDNMSTLVDEFRQGVHTIPEDDPRYPSDTEDSLSQASEGPR